MRYPLKLCDFDMTRSVLHQLGPGTACGAAEQTGYTDQHFPVAAEAQSKSLLMRAQMCSAYIWDIKCYDQLSMEHIIHILENLSLRVIV